MLLCCPDLLGLITNVRTMYVYFFAYLLTETCSIAICYPLLLFVFNCQSSRDHRARHFHPGKAWLFNGGRSGLVDCFVAASALSSPYISTASAKCSTAPHTRLKREDPIARYQFLERTRERTIARSFPCRLKRRS